MKAIYVGTFDPFTLGHKDIAVRASKLFDKLFVAIAADSGKNAVNLDLRLELAQMSLINYGNIEVLSYSGLTTDFMNSQNIKVLVRGIRDSGDLENERRLNTIYKTLADVEIITLFSNHAHISSTTVRELVKLGADLNGYVDKSIENMIKRIYR